MSWRVEFAENHLARRLDFSSEFVILFVSFTFIISRIPLNEIPLSKNYSFYEIVILLDSFFAQLWFVRGRLMGGGRLHWPAIRANLITNVQGHQVLKVRKMSSKSDPKFAPEWLQTPSLAPEWLQTLAPDRHLTIVHSAVSATAKKFKMAELLLSLSLASSASASASVLLSLSLLERVGCEIILLLNRLLPCCCRCCCYQFVARIDYFQIFWWRHRSHPCPKLGLRSR